ncbi:hypothetical protein AX14_006766 [Amanita brunnescens Koide BX004]|nr:hypothetical protein AX14_006766 [Amanita brunnescens Koide BX004]
MANRNNNAAASKKQRRPHPYLPEQAVPKPSSSSVTPKGALANCFWRDRSVMARKEATRKVAEHRLSDFLKYADKYQLPFTLAQLQALNNEKNPKLRKKYEGICYELNNVAHPSRPFSAIYYDLDGIPVFAYFGVRWEDDTVSINQHCPYKS